MCNEGQLDSGMKGKYWRNTKAHGQKGVEGKEAGITCSPKLFKKKKLAVQPTDVLSFALSFARILSVSDSGFPVFSHKISYSIR